MASLLFLGARSSLTFIDTISLLQLTPPRTKYAKTGEFIPHIDGQWSVKGLPCIPELLWGEKGVAALRGLKETLQAFMRHLRKTTHLGASFTILGEFVFPLALEVIYTGVCVCGGGGLGGWGILYSQSNIEVIQMKTGQTIIWIMHLNYVEKKYLTF